MITMTSKIVWVGTFFCLAMNMVGHASATTETSIAADDQDRLILATAMDAIVKDPTGAKEDVSIRDLKTKIDKLEQELATAQENITSLQTQIVDLQSTVSVEVLQAIEEAVEGSLDKTADDIVAVKEDLVGKISENTALIDGFSETKETLADVVEDVVYLLSHSENVSYCAQDSGIHVGGGECAPTVPKCDKPDAPKGGNVTLSNHHYIIPGTTATYTCSQSHYFVKGPQKRVCLESGKFTPEVDPTCEECTIANCLECAGTKDKCAKCTYGHDLSQDSSSCTERQDAVLILGGSPPFSGHNWRELHILKANQNSWENYYPYPPSSFNMGAAGLLHGHVVGITFAGSTWTLDVSSGNTASWKNDARYKVPYTCGNSGCRFPFFATVNTQGASVDGVFHFSTVGSSVFRFNQDGSIKGMTALRNLGNGDNDISRLMGATAVVGKMIYLIGGQTRSNKVSDRVDIWDASKDFSAQFIDGTKMNSARMGHSATSYGTDIYVFGGSSQINSRALLTTVEKLDTKTKQWSTLSSLPMAMSIMTTGPLPVFPSGDVLVPGAHVLPSRNSPRQYYKYSIKNNKWESFPTASRAGGKYVALIGSL